MAQKLIYINQNKTNAIAWLKDNTFAYDSPSNKYYRSIVFTNDGFIITHGKVYDGNNTVTSVEDLEGLGFYQTSAQINGTSKTFFVDSSTATAGLSNIYAPTAVGTDGQILMSNGSGTPTPSWKSLLDVLKKATSTTNISTGYVLKYNGTGLAWENPATIDTTYKITINGTVKGTTGGDVDLGTVYAPTSGGTAGQILQANSSGIPAWTNLSTSIGSGLTSTDRTIPTSYAVYQAIEAAKTQAMVYKGVVSAENQLPTNVQNGSVVNGDVYKFNADSGSYKTGDLAIAKVNNNTVVWEKVPSGDETETFITIESAPNTAVSGYESLSGTVVLGNAALKYALSSSTTNPISSNTTSDNLVSAKQVVDYISSLNYSTTTGTVTNITTGVGLTGGPITSTGEIKANLASETQLTAPASGGLYDIGIKQGGTLAVSVPWTDTKHNFYVGGTQAKANGTVNQGTTVYLTTKLTSAASSANGTNIAGFKQDTGIQISATGGVITFKNSAPNVQTSMLIGASNSTANATTTNGNTYIRLREGDSYTNFNIVGSGATSVTSNDSGTLTIASLNTWRPILAYNAQNVAAEVLGNSITTNTLAFGSEFMYLDTTEHGTISEIHLAWAEVDSEGTVTYAV